MPPKIVSRSQNKPRFQINLQLSESALGLTARNLAQLYHTTDQFMPDKSKIAAEIEDIEVETLRPLRSLQQHKRIRILSSHD